MQPAFYIYRHIRPDTDQVFYVGKGTWSSRHRFERAFTDKLRSRFWQAIVAEAGGFTAEVMMLLDDEGQATRKEKEFIALYGRRNLGQGTLCNLTDGGEGHCGFITPDELRQKRSLRMSGSGHPNYGKRLSAETCRRKSVAVSGERSHLFGKRLPKAWREHIAAAKIGDLNPMSGKTGFLHHNGKHVVNQDTGVMYGSISEAARVEGVNFKTLYNCLTGHRVNRTSLRLA